jgi:integrase/recombinase XerD
MLTHAIDAYLAIRRTAGFQLGASEGLLRLFAEFATTHGESYVSAQRAVEWAGQADH